MEQYQFEYMKIHDQRVFLHQFIVSYFNSSILYSSTLMAAFIGLGAQQKLPWLYIVGGIMSCSVLFFGIRMIDTFDRSIFRLYPRIIALELILKYHFYRHYLRGRGGEYEKFVADCEQFPAEDRELLWKNIVERASGDKFEYNRDRPAVRLRLRALIFLTCAYLVIAGTLFYVRP